MDSLLHDHRVGRLRLDGAVPRPHAGAAQGQGFWWWLDGSLGPEALKPAPEEALREWKVSPRLNRTGVGDDRRDIDGGADVLEGWSARKPLFGDAND